MILNSFKYAGISNLLYGSQVYKFRGDEDLEKGNETIKLKNEVALDQEDHYVTRGGSNQ